MYLKIRVPAAFGVGMLLLATAVLLPVKAQTQIARHLSDTENVSATESKTEEKPKEPSSENRLVRSVLPDYFDQAEGLSLTEIVKRAFASNGEIEIALLEVEKARARFQQARLRQNPTLEVEQSSGSFVGSKGDGELTVGFALPLDVYNQRGKRMKLAETDIALREAELSSSKKRLLGKILTIYSDALAALQELKVLEDLLELDTRTTRFVQIRVNEGASSPLELNLLQTEVERLRSRRSLVEGKLQASLANLKFYAGLDYQEPLKLREDIRAANLPKLPGTLETSFAVALKNRPEIRIAELEENLATAGLRLIRTQSKPDVTAYTRYTQRRAGFDDPRGEFFQRDRSLTFGVAIGLPIFNKNQGAKEEAKIAIRQAQEKRTFAEQMIKAEVAAAFRRIAATNQALSRLETAVLPRSRKNVETITRVYEIGELKITDLINEQRRLLDANSDLTEVLTERYRANADLFIALGIEF
ncbi:MAG: TolC family protein [Acidobacteria bacterium]|mgnify:CR=1 FL=1|nr:MAG: TolC family protein [Acidobacteriota bacterium]REJ98240.1 MAG: TolC family protein [Acidobacteriota bacterium]REK16984.1 MAG: TolC family protein [Acidobacteriota bacterium]REK42894.1 MAG: TolC family protein [Acidobacteriota bacterium]